MLSNFLVSTIPPRVQVLAIVASGIVLLLVVDLIRRGRMKEGYSIGWFGLGLVMLVFSLFTPLLDQLARLVGIAYSPAALLLILSGGLILLALHYSVLVTRFDRQIADLAQEHALLKHELDDVKGKKKL